MKAARPASAGARPAATMRSPQTPVGRADDGHVSDRGVARRTSSISRAEILKPPLLMKSTDFRPAIVHVTGRGRAAPCRRSRTSRPRKEAAVSSGRRPSSRSSCRCS